MAQENCDSSEAAQIARLERSLRGLLFVCQERVQERFKHHPLFEKMAKSSKVAIEHLSHPDPTIRLLAFDVLNTYFQDLDIGHLAPQLQRMAVNDSEKEIRKYCCRLLATIAWDAAARQKKDIAHVLAQIVEQTDEDPGVRLTAYKSLCTLSEHYDVRIRSCDDVVFPHDVDWRYVRGWK